jgi:hypothetical protein
VRRKRAEEARAATGGRPGRGTLEAWLGAPRTVRPAVRIAPPPAEPTAHAPHDVPMLHAATAEAWVGLGAALDSARKPVALMWAAELGHPGAIPRLETLRGDILEGGRFYERKVLAGLHKKRGVVLHRRYDCWAEDDLHRVGIVHRGFGPLPLRVRASLRV